MEEDPKTYWRDVCAPKLRARKDDLGGRKLPQREISDYVLSTSGRKGKRAAVGHFLSGKREPYFSQFIALCAKLEIDPAEVVREPKSLGPGLRLVNEEKLVSKRTMRTTKKQRHNR